MAIGLRRGGGAGERLVRGSRHRAGESRRGVLAKHNPSGLMAIRPYK